MTFEGASAESTRLEFSSWAGLQSLSDHLVDVSASGNRGRQLDVQQVGDAWEISHDLEEAITLVYQIAPNALQINGSGRQLFRPLVSQNLIQLIGHSALLLPTHYQEEFKFSFNWLPHPFATAFNSFEGESEVRDITTTLSELRGALFVFGYLQIEERNIAGQPLYYPARQAYRIRTVEI